VGEAVCRHSYPKRADSRTLMDCLGEASSDGEATNGLVRERRFSP